MALTILNAGDDFKAPLPASYAAPQTSSIFALGKTKVTLDDRPVDNSSLNPAWVPTGRATLNL